MGKTRIAKFLQKEFDYAYEDIEEWQARDEELCVAPENPDISLIDLRIRKFVGGQDKVVAVFGFRPASKVDVAIVERLTESWNFSLFWFDGNRSAALREYFKRELPIYEKLDLKDFYARIWGFFLQIERIDSTNICRKISPISPINPFKADHSFKSEQEIIREMMALI